MKWLFFAAIAISVLFVANCEAADDLKALINDAANDFHDAKGELTYSSEGHESYDSKLELKDCEDPSIWKRPNGDLEFTCEIVPNSPNMDAVTALLAERIKSIQAEIPSGWKTKTFPDAKPYEDFFIAADHKAHLELNVHIVPYQDDSYDAVLTLKKAFEKTITPDSRKEALMKLEGKGIEFSPDGFLKKIAEGDVDSVQLLLDAGIDPNSKDNEESSALMIASHLGFPDIVTLLLDRGANPNAKNRYGNTAIIEAVVSRDLCFFNRGLESENAPECNQSQVDFEFAVQHLLDVEADPNAKDNGGTSALFFASNDPEIAEVLLSNGADVNLRNKDGRTLLIESVKDNAAEFVKLLLNHKADSQIKDAEGKSAIDYAGQLKSNEIMELLKAAGAKNN